MTAESRNGCVAVTMSFRASSIMPRPTPARPRSRQRVASVLENSATPSVISTGDRIARLNETSWATSDVPTSAPSMTASAIAVPTKPRAANEAVISAVAVELCSRAVTPSPQPKARKRLPRAEPMAARRSPPNARITPVRTMRRPHSSRATPPARWIRIEVAPIFGSSGRGGGRNVMKMSQNAGQGNRRSPRHTSAPFARIRFSS